ncbi:UNVERIFIED_ORG: D-amino-acid dehydrogenase [Variovorax paradoxus]|nr:D-amino-acid dehydrogenase [Variovorax paradoxus]
MGAGIVGVSCALELQRRGHEVTLFDRTAPGRETSYGNAGVIARSSLMPFNHPGLWSVLPRLLKNTAASFRYDPVFLARNLSWAVRFLACARASVFQETAAALDALIRLSISEHRRLLVEAQAAQRLRTNGWLFLYRSEGGFAGSRLSRETFERFGVATQVLNADDLSDLEPHLKPLFPRALWIKDTDSVDSPGQVVEAYARLFVSRGGQVRQAAIGGLGRSGTGGAWELREESGAVLEASKVVLALGPWTREFLQKSLGLSVPMAFERGYHMHYNAVGNASLGRPVYDTGGAYVLSPMAQGLRLSTGVQLAQRDAPRNLVQLELAERAAREAFPLESRLEAQAWMGSRPTLPDSRPIVGECPRHPGLWLAFGHQHIGFSTGPGTARLLASLMRGEPCDIDPLPFAPGRFLR